MQSSRIHRAGTTSCLAYCWHISPLDRAREKRCRCLPVDWDSVSDIDSIDTLNLTKRVLRVNAPDLGSVATLWELVLSLLRLSVVEAENAGPLLNSLVVVLRGQSRVCRAVVDLETRPGTVVSGVHSVDNAGPVLRRSVDVALRAGRVPSVDSVGLEAACWDTRVGSRGNEKLWVGSGHDVGHHCTGAGASYENLAGIAVVLIQGVCDHVGDGIALTAAVVGESGLRRDIVAGALVWRLWVDDNEPILISQLSIWRASVVSLSSATAVVCILLASEM